MVKNKREQWTINALIVIGFICALVLLALILDAIATLIFMI